MLDIRGITKIYNPGTVQEMCLFNDFSLSIGDGQFVSVVGSNGSGKTSLLNLICGSITPDAGSIVMNGRDIAKDKEFVRSRVIGRVYQNPAMGTCGSMTILENLTWNGHKDSVIWEWVAKDGAGDRHYNAHNAFFGVAYNNGFIAGLLLVAYTALAFIRALRYYWAHRKESPYAATPLAFCTVFILVGMFESVYAPFSVIGCAYFLVQAPLWRAE